MNNYWRLQRHAYMGLEKPDPALVRFLDRELVSWFGHRDLHIVDLGSGYGRYSFPLVELGYCVKAVEIQPEMTGYLQKISLITKGKLKVENRCCLEFLKDFGQKQRLDAILMLHLLHHLSREQFSELQRIILDFPSEVPILAVEPNRYNLLYPLMILTTPGMKWQEEKALYQDRAARLYETRSVKGLPNRKLKYICPWPPALSRAMDKLSYSACLNPSLSALGSVIPFICSYRYALL